MAASSKVSLKLFIDTKSQSVIFAEADKTTVDFLFHILSLPMGAVMKFLSKEQMLGSLRNLYDSIDILSETYTQSKKNKESLINPKGPFASPFSSPLLALPPQDRKHDCFSINSVGYRPHCCLSTKTASVDMGVGFVKGVATYMVMDDLVVKPISTVALLNMLDAKVLRSTNLEERVVDIGNDEAVDLLKTTLVSKTVLTTVFLKNMSK